MTIEELEILGRAIYGRFWQVALSHDLGVSDRTVRRWAAGVNRVPPEILEKLLRMAWLRIDEINAAIRMVDKD